MIGIPTLKVSKSQRKIFLNYIKLTKILITFRLNTFLISFKYRLQGKVYKKKKIKLFSSKYLNIFPQVIYKTD